MAGAMAYYQAPQERPRHVKRFLTVRDIEDAATSGCREILHVDDLVITDAAREAAHDLGVAIVKPDPGRQASAANAPSLSAQSAAATQPPPIPRSSLVQPGAAASHQPVAMAPSKSVPAFTPPPAFVPPPGAHADEHPLVQDLARAIRARWRPVQRRQRQLLA